MRTILAFALAFSAFQVGCGAQTSSGGKGDMATAMGPLTGLMSIDVSPATASLTVTNGATATTSFAAMGHFADGHMADVTTLVTWSLDDNSLGSIAAGVVTANGLGGGKTQVTAASGSATGLAQLTVKYTATEISTADSSTAPANSPALFTGATTADPTLAPAVLYPLDGVVIPNNLGELEVQWQKPTGTADLYEVAFLGETIDLRIYTNAPETAGGRISLSAADWTVLAGSTAGTSFTVQVTGLATADPTKSGASALTHVTMDADPVNGGIYYWTPTNQGVERHAFGDTTGMETNFYSETNTGGRCVACHVLTRDGKKAAITFDGGGGVSAVLDVATLTETLPESKAIHFDFGTFAPDGSKLIGTNGAGLLIEYDTSGTATEGNTITTFTPPAGSYYSHPDWSADGKSLVLVQTTTANAASDYSFTGGSIVVMTGPGDGTFSNPKAIVQSAGENNYYPSFSPDGLWILFNRAPERQASYNNAAVPKCSWSRPTARAAPSS